MWDWGFGLEILIFETVHLCCIDNICPGRRELQHPSQAKKTFDGHLIAFQWDPGVQCGDPLVLALSDSLGSAFLYHRRERCQFHIRSLSSSRTAGCLMATGICQWGSHCE